MKNIIHDLTFYFSDPSCDSLRKLSDISGWTKDGLNVGGLWTQCGGHQAWHGYKGASGVGSISTTLPATGRAELSFGNCWHNPGTVKVYLDGTEIASAGPKIHKTVAFDFDAGSVLSIHDEGVNSVIQISEFKILNCEGFILGTGYGNRI